jgi:hypothetical protein
MIAWFGRLLGFLVRLNVKRLFLRPRRGLTRLRKWNVYQCRRIRLNAARDPQYVFSVWRHIEYKSSLLAYIWVELFKTAERIGYENALGTGFVFSALRVNQLVERYHAGRLVIVLNRYVNRKHPMNPSGESSSGRA